MANATLFDFFISQICHDTSTFCIQYFCLEDAWWWGRKVVWRLVWFGATLTWLWLGLKSAEDLTHTAQWRSTVRTLINRPMERFAWTNHNCFQIRPSPAVVPLHLCTSSYPTRTTGTLASYNSSIRSGENLERPLPWGWGNESPRILLHESPIDRNHFGKICLLCTVPCPPPTLRKKLNPSFLDGFISQFFLHNIRMSYIVKEIGRGGSK